MVKILVLYYTRTGNTEALAKAVAEGVKSVKGVSVVVKRVDYATVQGSYPVMQSPSAHRTISATCPG